VVLAETHKHQEVRMKPTVAVLYGDAGSAATIHALKLWRDDYAPGCAYDSMFAQYITSTEIHTTIYPGGRATIHVVVAGRRLSSNDDYYFEATVTGGELKLDLVR
jgi:hypothetical protein